MVLGLFIMLNLFKKFSATLLFSGIILIADGILDIILQAVLKKHKDGLPKIFATEESSVHFGDEKDDTPESKPAEDEYEEYDRPRAIRMYRRTIEMCQYVVSSDYPLKADYYDTLGLLYDYFGESTEAIKMYQCAIDSGFEVGPIYLKIAMVYENDEDCPNAIATYKKIIEGGDEMSSHCKKLAEDNLKRLEGSI